MKTVSITFLIDILGSFWYILRGHLIQKHCPPKFADLRDPVHPVRINKFG